MPKHMMDFKSVLAVHAIGKVWPYNHQKRTSPFLAFIDNFSSRSRQAQFLSFSVVLPLHRTLLPWHYTTWFTLGRHHGEQSILSFTISSGVIVLMQLSGFSRGSPSCRVIQVSSLVLASGAGELGESTVVHHAASPWRFKKAFSFVLASASAASLGHIVVHHASSSWRLIDISSSAFFQLCSASCTHVCDSSVQFQDIKVTVGKVTLHRPHLACVSKISPHYRLDGCLVLHHHVRLWTPLLFVIQPSWFFVGPHAWVVVLLTSWSYKSSVFDVLVTIWRIRMETSNISINSHVLTLFVLIHLVV